MNLTGKIHLLQIDFEIVLGPDRKIPRFVNVLLILADKITIVDTGVKGSEKRIFQYLVDNNRDPSEIDTIILSHAHPDHIGSAARIKELTGCKIMAHRLEKDWIENIELQSEQRPVPGFFHLVDTPVTVDEYIEDQQTIQIDAGINMTCTLSAGHSMGMLNLLFEEDKLFFTADSIPLKNDIPNYHSYPDLKSSLDRIIKQEGYNMMLTSWTQPLTGLQEIKALISEGETYLEKIDAVVKEFYTGNDNGSLEECSKVVEKMGLPPFLVTPVVDQAFRSHLAR